MQKESFILHNSFYEPIKLLKNEQLGKLFRSIFNYTINGEIPQDSDILVAFMFIKNQIDLDSQKWEEEKKKRSEAGKKGMASRWNKDNNTDNNVITSYNNDNNVKNVITKITDNVNVNVNVNDNVNDNIVLFIESNFGRTLNSIEYEQILQWEDNELTRYAIKQAILNGKYNIKYISRILENYKLKGIKTIQEAQQKEEEFKNKTTKNQVNTTEWLNEDIKENKATKEEIERFKKQLEG